MTSITIIGINESSAELIKNIRSLSQDVEINLIGEGEYLFNSWAICDWLTRKENCSIVKLDDFITEYKVNLISTKAERINFNKKKIFLKDTDFCIYEKLVISTRLKSKDISVKGDHRQGFFYLSSIKPYKVRDMFKISSDFIVYVSTIIGIDWVLKLTCFKKDIKCIFSDLSFLGDKKDKIIASLKQNNIDFYADCKLEEVIGENAIKAVRISRPMVLSSHVVICDSGFTSNHRFLKDDLSQIDIFGTNQEDVFLLGAVCEKELEDDFFFIHTKENLNTQTAILANHLINNESLDYQSKINTEEEVDVLIDKILVEFYTESPSEEREKITEDVSVPIVDDSTQEENVADIVREEKTIKENISEEPSVEEKRQEVAQEKIKSEQTLIEEIAENVSGEVSQISQEEPKLNTLDESLKLDNACQEILKLNGPEELQKLEIINTEQDNLAQKITQSDKIGDSSESAIN